ncbi:hypothetical protein NEIG_02084 [Nematocida sp. ERTm5]|nr:hypothetical protein NEIG_02084 [Nematocida sp. ERTm5]
MEGVQFQRVQTVMRIPIYPYQLNNITEYTYKYLNKYIGLYIKALKGVIMCYTESIGVLDNVGIITGTDPKVYVKLSVEFILLKIIKNGTVTSEIKTNPTGTGMYSLIHGTIPVQVSGRVQEGLYKYEIVHVCTFPLYVVAGNLSRVHRID